MEAGDNLKCPKKVEKPTEVVYDPSLGIQQFQIENITVIRPPILKAYYWDMWDIAGFNEKLLADNQRIEHNFHIPTRLLNSKPFKFVLWLRSSNENRICLKLKRIKNCKCKPLQTQVGFNQFRHLYHCPHRHLVNISQERYDIQPHELVAMSVVSNFFLYGTNILSYELSCSDGRIIIFNFDVTSITFDPLQSIITRELIPVNINEPRRMVQAIWVRNITMQNLRFRFVARNRGLRLINSNLIVPRQSVWPLLVEYMPSDFNNHLIITMIADGHRCNLPFAAKGILGDYIEKPSSMPLYDYECADYLYVLYPNKLEFILEFNEVRSLLLAVHNYDQKCMQFVWQNYSINGFFTLTFEPLQFTLKPHHTKLCWVHCRAYKKALHFRYLPAVLEVHNILDKSTQIARKLINEIDSIDDPKWLQDSYKHHILLHIDLKVKFPPIPAIAISEQDAKSSCITIFEKLFWEYLARSNFMRNTSKIPKNLTYEQILERPSPNDHTTVEQEGMTRNHILSYIGFMVGECCQKISKNYRFVPTEIMETPEITKQESIIENLEE